MLFKVLLLGLVGAATALPQFYGVPQPSYTPVYQQPQYEEEGRPYQFHYSVNDEYVGAHYQHYANSDGENVEGSYKVQLPDGRLQTVTYKADPTYGYMAEVTFEGEAVYPAYNPTPQYGYQ